MSRKYPAESYQREEILALLEACGQSAVGKRNRALIAVLWRSGLRLGEALALMPRDIDWNARTIRVLHGKGDKARTVAVDRQTLEVIDEWLAARGKHVDEQLLGSAPLFCTLRGNSVDQSYVRAMFPRLAKRANIDRRIHAHGLRHTFAVELSRAGTPVRDIQQLLGHSSLATTSVYLASLSPEEALNRVRNREW